MLSESNKSCSFLFYLLTVILLKSEVGVGGGTVALITPRDIPREVASSF